MEFWHLNFKAMGKKKIETLLKEYAFEYPSQYYDMILESVINGNIKQSKEQFLAMPKLNQILFINNANLTERQRQAFTMLLL